MIDDYLKLSYLDVTSKVFYSLVLIFPMLFIYEVMCLFQFAGSVTAMRNGADVFIRQLFVGFGNHSESVYAIVLLLIIIVIMYFSKNVIWYGELKFSFLIYMFLESLL